jgi:hypothetical protein
VYAAIASIVAPTRLVVVVLGNNIECPVMWRDTPLAKLFGRQACSGGEAVIRLHEAALHFEGEAQLGHIARLGQGTPGTLLDAMQSVPHGIGMAEQQVPHGARRPVVIHPCLERVEQGVALLIG